MFPKSKRAGVFLPLVAIYWFSFYGYSSIFTEYVREFSTSQMAGTILASYGFMQMIVRIPVGLLSDKLKTRKWFVTIGMVLSAISAIGLATFKTAGAALIFRGLAGVAVSTWVPFSILFSSYLDPERATRSMGIINAFNFGGQMAATLLGGLLADWMGDTKWAFYLSALGAVVAAALSVFIIDQPKEEFSGSATSLTLMKTLVKDKKLMLAAGLQLMCQFAAFASVYGFTPTFAKENMGATQSQLGILTTLITLFAMVSSAVSGRFARWLKGTRNAILLSFILTAVYLLAVPFIHNLYLLFLVQIVCGFTRGISTSLLMGYCIEDIAPESRGTAMGFYQAIYGIGMSLGPAIVGAFGRSEVGEANIAGLTTGFLVIAATQIAAGFLGWYYMKKLAAVRR